VPSDKTRENDNDSLTKEVDGEMINNSILDGLRKQRLEGGGANLVEPSDDSEEEEEEETEEKKKEIEKKVFDSYLEFIKSDDKREKERIRLIEEDEDYSGDEAGFPEEREALDLRAKLENAIKNDIKSPKDAKLLDVGYIRSHLAGQNIEVDEELKKIFDEYEKSDDVRDFRFLRDRVDRYLSSKKEYKRMADSEDAEKYETKMEKVLGDLGLGMIDMSEIMGMGGEWKEGEELTQSLIKKYTVKKCLDLVESTLKRSLTAEELKKIEKFINSKSDCGIGAAFCNELSGYMIEMFGEENEAINKELFEELKGEITNRQGKLDEKNKEEFKRAYTDYFMEGKRKKMDIIKEGIAESLKNPVNYTMPAVGLAYLMAGPLAPLLAMFFIMKMLPLIGKKSQSHSKDKEYRKVPREAIVNDVKIEETNNAPKKPSKLSILDDNSIKKNDEPRKLVGLNNAQEGELNEIGNAQKRELVGLNNAQKGELNEIGNVQKRKSSAPSPH
jgi:hypothetical protein